MRGVRQKKGKNRGQQERNREETAGTIIGRKKWKGTAEESRQRLTRTDSRNKVKEEQEIP